MGGGCVCSLRMTKCEFFSSVACVTLSPNVGYCCLPFKRQPRAQLLRKKSLLSFRCRHLQGEWTSFCPKADCPSPQLANRGTSALIDRGRGLLAKTEVSSNSHFEINHQWSEQHHRDCFRHSKSTVPGSLYSHLLETSSLNCGSLCHSYSLVIM